MLLDHLGVEVYHGLNRPFDCPLHLDDRHSVRVWRPPDRGLLFVDHQLDGCPTLTLGQLYAFSIRGRVVELGRPGHAIWLRRVMADLGLVEPATVPLPQLPHGASMAAELIYNAIEHLIGIRWLREKAPAAITRRFMSDWCGITEKSAGAAINELIELNVITQVGSHGRTRLFLPHPEA